MLSRTASARSRTHEFHQPEPVREAWQTTWSQVSTGGAHTCAIRSSPIELHCWGSNSAGQLGNGHGGHAAVPLQVAGSGWLSVSSSEEYTCGLQSPDQVRCTGYGYTGIGVIITWP